MTYCVAISVNDGLVLCSDSRTNAGVDQVSTYSKMHCFGQPGNRQFILLSAGNLATTQSVVSQINRDIREANPGNLMSVPTLDEAADYIGRISLAEQEKHAGRGVMYEASFILAGQLSFHPAAAFLIYPQGNHITTSPQTPYLQIGESKYGKPVLDRIITLETSLEDCAKAALVSMDSTIRSNVSVGPPIELLIYQRDTLALDAISKLDEDSPYLREIKRSWDFLLKEAFKQLPPIAWSKAKDQKPVTEQSQTTPPPASPLIG
jgi:putative proteasome-type protease